MKPFSLASLIVLLVFASLLPSALTANSQLPVGSCPPGFETHEIGEHMEGDHTHHIGIAEDLNGDGLICVLHLDNELHVHVDNVIR